MALTLRALGGLTTEEIARAFLVRARDHEAAAVAREAEDQGGRDPVQRAADHLLPGRLAAVLGVVYLIFNEGYGGRVDLASEGASSRRRPSPC